MSQLISETIREIEPSAQAGSYNSLSCLSDRGRFKIYLAEKSGKRIVLKAPSDNDAKSLALLQREWDLSIGLSHPSLAYCFAYEETSPVGPCIAREYVDGRSLSDWLGENPSLEQRKKVFAQLLSVMEYLHKKGVIHNDLSPSNILVSRADNALKLIDLGFADNDMQLMHSLGGTRNYSSPELLAGQKVDARSDIWSLGAIMREMFPGRYRRIAAKAMRPEPELRYRSADSLERAWRRYWLPLKVCAVAMAVICLASAFLLRSRKLHSEIDALTHQLDSVNAVTLSREASIREYKDSIDSWYDKELPAFLEQLRSVSDYGRLNAVYSDFVGRMGEFNTSLPEAAPEEIRPIVRDHIVERYNSAVSSAGEAVMAKSRSMAGNNN